MDTALKQDRPVEQAAQLYFTLGEYLSLDWFMAQIVGLQPDNRWQDLARESYVDDLESQRRRLTACLLAPDTGNMQLVFEDWQIQQQPLISPLAVHGQRFAARCRARFCDDFRGSERAS